MSTLLIILIRLYQLALSPFLGNCCRFQPSCSAYFIEAINQRGAFKGMLLGLRRLGRCHPFHPGGFDPVPAEHHGLKSMALPFSAKPADSPLQRLIKKLH